MMPRFNSDQKLSMIRGVNNRQEGAIAVAFTA
jgi:hypothetical protein